MRKILRIIVRIIYLPFIISWDFQRSDLIPTLRGILQWVLIYPHTDFSEKAEHEKLVDIYSKVK